MTVTPHPHFSHGERAVLVPPHVRREPAAQAPRAELFEAMRALETALAAANGGREWWTRVRDAIERLRYAFAEHITVTEGSDGLYAELRLAAPRLTRSVDTLICEHSAISARMDALATRLEGYAARLGDAGPPQLRARAAEVLADLSDHRRLGADLLHEAYAIDIGGET